MAPLPETGTDYWAALSASNGARQKNGLPSSDLERRSLRLQCLVLAADCAPGVELPDSTLDGDRRAEDAL
jgi:hypothetical protein